MSQQPRKLTIHSLDEKVRMLDSESIMEPGRVLERRYRIDREIGRGEFGVVYLADDLDGGRRVAVKVLLPWAKRNEQLRHRLKREAKLAGMLKSEHAVRIHELLETDEQDLAIVMEFLDGESLTELIARERKLDPERVTRIAAQVLDALSEAHGLGVIHRDIKPGNIFILRGPGGEDRVKVLDFGIAKQGASGMSDTAKLTQQGGTVGTPVYMSPEQCRGEDLTPTSDLYSLGVVLYELLTGRVPFDDENPVRVLMMHNDDPPPPMPAPLASERVGLAVMRALNKSPRDRFANSQAFLAALGIASVKQPSPKQWVAEVKEPGAARAKSPSGGLGPALKRYWLVFVVAALVGAAIAGYFLD